MKSSSNPVANCLAFTLIELLVVLAIISILASSILIGISPVETLKKTKDTTTIHAASEMYASIERYTSRYGSFPWSNPAIYRYNHLDLGIGTESEVGVLISSGEMRSSFRDVALKEKVLYGGQDSGGGEEFMICFLPLSKTAKLYLQDSTSAYNGFVYRVLTNTATDGVLTMSVPDSSAPCDVVGGWDDSGQDGDTVCVLCIQGQ